MFNLNEGNRYFLCSQGVDLLKGLNGLCGVIRHLSFNPTSVYIFVNKTRTTMKLLHWERGGFVIYL
jgi:hypothetical protein